jgi:hypothetical protein
MALGETLSAVDTACTSPATETKAKHQHKNYKLQQNNAE